MPPAPAENTSEKDRVADSAGRATVRSLGDVVYEAIFSMIVDGAFAVDTKLPSEAVLATRFNVSRPVLREALARLRDDGLIVSRQGSGSFVIRQPDRSILSFTALSGIADLQRCYEFRIGFEGEAAYIAAQRRSDKDIVEMGAALARIEGAISRNALGVDNDFQFHMAICNATENRFYVSVMHSLQQVIKSGISVTRNLSLLHPRYRLQLVQEEHHRIYEAVSRRDADGAREAMRMHVQNAKQRAFEG